MLHYTNTFTTFSSNDLDKAQTFYGTVLGLPVTKTSMGGLSLKLPGNDVIIYPKPNHEPATFTVLNFQVASVEAAVDQLISQGVQFQQYGGDIQTDAKGIFRGRGPVIAWFADPAGNILSLIEENPS